MAFAGHPTIGTSFVMLDEGIVPAESEYFMLEEKVGPVAICVERGSCPLIWLRTPPITEGRTFDRRLCAQALGVDLNDLLDIDPQLLDAGNPTVFIALRDKYAVDRARLDAHGSSFLKDGYQEPICVFVFAPTPDGAYSRMFAPEYGISEDPATGSSTGPLAKFMMRHGLVSGVAGAGFTSEQGTKMGRRSILHVRILSDRGQDRIEVGGSVVPVAEAVMKL